MFDQARLKLTLWYSLIIVTISLSFSFFIYQLLQNELKRIALVQQQRFYGDLVAPGNPVPLVFDQEILDESRKRLVSILLLVNGAILVVGGGLGYLLAGETLKPIQDMVENQNRFISDASHELRTPLTALKSTMEVSLRDKNLTIAEARVLLKESIEEVDKLQRLSDNLLQLAKTKHPANRLVFEKIQLAKVVQQALKKVKPLAHTKEITLKTHSQLIQLEAQSESLIQSLVIMLDNAIKYSPEKSIVTITTKKTGSTAEIAITDQGVGITSKDIPHIFDRFYRTDSARSKPAVGGYGLGLSIAHQIISSHQGHIVVKSQPGRGTTFTVTLPLSQTRSL